MAGLRAPQSQAGLMSFYDAQSSGPKLNPKVLVAAVVLFTIIVLIADHFRYG